MKTVITLFVVLLLGSAVRGQDSTQFLLGDDQAYSGFGGIMTSVSSIDDRAEIFFGGGGGVLINQQFFFGGYGMGNASDGYARNFNGTDVALEVGHGGLWLGYVLFPEKVIHAGFSSRFGWGGIGLRDASNNLLLNDNAFFLNPQAEVELNVLPFLKLNLGLEYQTAFGVRTDHFSSTDFNSTYGLLGLYFGWFEDE